MLRSLALLLLLAACKSAPEPTLSDRALHPRSKLDDEYEDAESSAPVTLPWKEKPVAYRDLQNLIAQEPDAEHRQLAFAAMNSVRVAKLNPILERKEEAAQKAARETGFADYVSFSEDLRQVEL